MNRFKTLALASIALLICPLIASAQLSNIVVVDFERAVVECAEGKKASEKFNATLQAKQGELEKKQKELEDQQKKLQNGARTLSEQTKGELQKDIDRRTREMQRLNEDAQKDLQGLRDELLRPIAERATAILNAMASEKGYTLVVDLSNQESNVLWFNKNNDVTEELIKRIDAATPQGTAKPAAPNPSSAAPNSGGNRPATPATPRPNNSAAPTPAAPQNPPK